MAFAVLLALVFFNEMKIATQRFASLTPAAAVQLMNNEDVVLLDVREPAETIGGKIAKAIQIPVGALGKRVSELEKHKNKTLLVYCKSGARAGTACKELSKNGFEKVFSLNGGIMAWQDAHLPVNKK
ncbi:MAG: rhodanese-like domain-containing protein [Gammaproteobacteria bacterium]|nr:rhodanese-like domain-containing protein [Gammaproteobacteria bacterium]MCP4979694.1 rhodanese-like domain-containing protein [Gammaproteobacteria bacterium]